MACTRFRRHEFGVCVYGDSNNLLKTTVCAYRLLMLRHLLIPLFAHNDRSDDMATFSRLDMLDHSPSSQAQLLGEQLSDANCNFCGVSLEA
jgi:hypothetical protein